VKKPLAPGRQGVLRHVLQIGADDVEAWCARNPKTSHDVAHGAKESLLRNLFMHVIEIFKQI
jgi:hypothetical protein